MADMELSIVLRDQMTGERRTKMYLFDRDAVVDAAFFAKAKTWLVDAITDIKAGTQSDRLP